MICLGTDKRVELLLKRYITRDALKGIVDIAAWVKNQMGCMQLGNLIHLWNVLWTSSKEL